MISDITETGILKIIDRIVDEPEGGAHRDHHEAARLLKEALIEEIEMLSKIKKDKLLDNRIKKFGEMGFFKE